MRREVQDIRTPILQLFENLLADAISSQVGTDLTIEMLDRLSNCTNPLNTLFANIRIRTKSGPESEFPPIVWILDQTGSIQHLDRTFSELVDEVTDGIDIDLYSLHIVRQWTPQHNRGVAQVRLFHVNLGASLYAT